jgi:hypothetical protein
MRRKGQFRLGHELSSGDGERLPTTLQLSASFKGGEGPPNGSRLLPIRKQRRTSRAHQTALPLNQEAQQKKPTSRKRRKRIVSAIEIASKSSDEPNNTLRTPKDGAGGGSSARPSERAEEPYPADTGAAKKKLDDTLKGHFLDSALNRSVVLHLHDKLHRRVARAAVVPAHSAKIANFVGANLSPDSIQATPNRVSTTLCLGPAGESAVGPFEKHGRRGKRT